MNADMKIMTARLLMLIAVALGIIGLIAGFADKTWKLGAVGWFTGATAVGVLSLVTLGDAFVEWAAPAVPAVE